MRARDIMTRNVVSVTPDTPVLDVAALMVDHHVNAVVVLNGTELVGIVSEANLLHRYELDTQRDPAARPWWRRLLNASAGMASYVEAHAMKVQDVMATQVVTVEEDAAAADVAALFEARRIKQAPVVRSGAVVGIISRADFVRALVARTQSKPAAQAQGDAEILRALLDELARQRWWRPERSAVTVTDGVVHFSGQVNSLEEKAPARVAAENIPGVRAVKDSRTEIVPAAAYSAGSYL